jgi:hypothetical protein
MLEALTRPDRIANFACQQRLSFNLFFEPAVRELSRENCHRRFLQGVWEANNHRAYLNWDGPNIMTMPEAFASLIVILLSAIATWAWITMRKRAPRNWDFKERSLRYLNDIDRKKSQISTR